MTRRGISLVELVVSMAVLGLVLSLVGRTLVGQQRLYGDLHLREMRTRAMQQGTQILAAEVESLAADDGDVVSGQATDSAVEFHALIGSAVTCDLHGSTVRLPPAVDGNAPGFAAFVATPDVGDRLLAFDGESGAEQWRAWAIVAVQRGGAPCTWAGSQEGFTLTLDSVVTGGPFTAVRITRRTRYSLYRGGDQEWYLGMRDWNSGAGHFNSIQPVSGPFLAYHAPPASSGLRFSYADSNGVALGTPVANGASVRRVDVVVRVQSGGDSLSRLIAVRHAP